jgi:peptidyl-prolyl cis-trans isomerase D
MGTFERLRQLSPLLMGLFVIFFILFMVLADMDIGSLMGGGQDPQTAIIAEVNGEKIKYVEFEGRVRQAVEQQRVTLRNQGREGEDIDEDDIRAKIWQNMTDRALYESIANKAGIIYSDEVVADKMINFPDNQVKEMFSDSTGTFLKDVYLSYVTNPDNVAGYMGPQAANLDPQEKSRIVGDIRERLINMSDYTANQIVARGIQNLLGNAGSAISIEYSRKKYIAENSKTSFDYLSFNTSNIADPEVSNQEMKTWYDSHKEYMQEEARRKIKYIAFPVQASSTDSNNAFRKITSISNSLKEAQSIEKKNEIFDQKMNEYGGNTTDFTLSHDIDPNIVTLLNDLEIGNYYGPFNKQGTTTYLRLDDKRQGENQAIRARHILVKINSNKDSALKVARNIYKRARSGEDFSDMAIELSTDKGSAVNGGELGWFVKGSMVPKFEDAAFTLDIDEVSEPVETDFGFHIIKVDNKSSSEYKFSTIEITPRISSATKNQIFRKAYTFVANVEKGEIFDSLASKLETRSVESAFFNSTQTVLGNNFINSFAFSNPVGTISEPIELENYGVVVFMVSDAREKGPALFEDKAQEIRSYVLNEKKLDIAKENAVQALESINQTDFSLNESVQSASDVKNNGAIIGIGAREYALTETAFTLPLNTVSEPIRGYNGYYIIRVKSRKIVPDEQVEAALPIFHQTLIQNTARQVFYPMYQEIKKNAPLVDNRADWYRTY